MTLHRNRLQRLSGNKFSLILMILFIGVILAACGGNGDDSGDDGSNSDQPVTTPTSTIPIGQVIVPQAIVLASPNRNAEIIINLFEGDRREILKQTEPDRLGEFFYEVNLGTRTGWVPNYQLQVSGDVTLIQIVSAFPTPTVTLPAATSTTTLPPPSPSPTLTAPTLRLSEVYVLPTLSPTPTVSTATANFSGPVPASPTVMETVSPTQPVVFPLAYSPTPTSVLNLRLSDPPPLNITLPEGWGSEHVSFNVPLPGDLGATEITLSVYQGTLSNGVLGSLWIVWNFPNIAPITADTQDLDMWSDGLYYLRNVLFAPCNIGIDLDNRQSFSVGDYQGTGTYFSAVDCGEATDIAGWFVALQVKGKNYAFYVGVEPVDRIQEGLPLMETIIQSIIFP